MIEELVTLRELNRDTDMNFIIQSWLKSLRVASPFYRSIPKQMFYEAHKRSILETMDQLECSCLVASPANEPNIIVGYLVYEERSPVYAVLHYTYVKLNFREMGLANLMINKVAADRKLIATHYTRKIKNLSFNPYMFKMERL